MLTKIISKTLKVHMGHYTFIYLWAQVKNQKLTTSDRFSLLNLIGIFSNPDKHL